MKCTFFENGSSLAKNKIGSPFHITVREKLAAKSSGGINGILTAQKPAIDKNTSVTLNVQCNGLPDRSGCIFNGNIFKVEIICFHFQGVGIKRAVSSAVDFIEIIVERNNSFIGTFANNRQMAVARWNHQLFIVSTVFYENTNSRIGKCFAGIDGFLNRSEIFGTIGCDNKIVAPGRIRL